MSDTWYPDRAVTRRRVSTQSGPRSITRGGRNNIDPEGAALRLHFSGLAPSLHMRGEEGLGSRLRVLRRLFVVDRVMTQVVAHSRKGETVRCAG